MTEEKDLVAKRASYKGRLTMFENYLDDLDVTSLKSAEVNELQLRMGKIESLYGQYDEVQLKLECILASFEAHLADRAEFENRYFKVLSEAQDILAKHAKKQESCFDSAASDPSSRKVNSKLIRLPTIQLPKYNGSYENWLGFRDTFTSLIHSNDEIDDINKFHYLRASLEASAAVVIQSVEFSSDNYALAWKLLCDRFNNKRQLLQNHVSALFNIEPITRESSSHIKRVIDQVNKNLRSLETLGEPVKEWSTLLIHIISHKLDSKSFREWEEFKGGLDKNKTVTFEEFRNFLQNRADLLETLELSSIQSPQHNKNLNKLKTMVAVQDKIGNNNNTSSNKTQLSSVKPCPRCKGDHCLSNCAQFLALSNTDRLQLLPTYKVCFNCFKGNHYANHCKKPGCKICKRKHHTLIHVSENISSRSTLNNNDCTGVISGAGQQTAPALPSPATVEPAQVTLSANVAPTPSARASSSSERAPSPRAPPALDEELLRDAPLYPPLQYASPDYDDPEDPETSIEDSSIIVTPQLSEDKTLSDIEDISDNGDIPDLENMPDIGDINNVQDISDTNDSSEVETEDEGERRKRSSGADWEKGSKAANGRRIQTADTILNIRGALRDAIGDAGAAPGPRASSRVDAFVIRPAAPAPQPQAQARQAPRVQPSTSQAKHKELLVEPHARAKIPCELANVTDLRWYRDSELVNLPTSARGGEAMWAEPGGAVIARATRSDAAVWRCEGRDVNGNKVSGKPTELLVYEPVRSLYLAVDGRRLDAGNTWVPVRDKMVLEVRCVAEGGVPAPELSWRLLALEPALDHRPYLRTKPANYSREGVTWSGASVTAARELHNASLQCDAKQRRPPAPAAPGATNEAETSPAIHSTKLEIHVTYPPSFVISRWPGFGVALWAGGAAALRCDVDANPPARAWWRRDDAPPDSTPPQGGAERGSSASLRWPALSAQHGGWYRCRASWLDQEYSSIGYYLNVLSPDESSSVPSGASDTEGQKTEENEEEEEVDHQKVDVPLGGNVQLHCPKGSVGCWWRRVLGNASEGAWAPAGSHHAHGVLGIKEALYQEGGEYRCVGARGSDLARLRELKRVTLRVTGGATARAVSATAVAGGGWRLECGACGRALRVLWLLRGRAVPAALTPDLPQHCWRTVLHVTDPDEVWCVAGGAGGGAVAVFPPRAPAPARQTVRALHGASTAYQASLTLLMMTLVLLVQN